jgi:hypothetical protein
MFKMTFNEAMTIQRAQMVYYRQSIGRKGIKAIRRRTHCPADLDPNEPISCSDMFHLVPRGGAFEGLIRHRPQEYDNTSHALHDAIRRGLF